MKTDKEKDKALEQVLADIEKQFGKGSVMRLGADAHLNIETTSSGSITLDIALGAGGYPKGRIIEIYGPESSGKTTFALHAIAEAQKQGGRVAFIDAEHALDPTYAAKIGAGIEYVKVSMYLNLGAYVDNQVPLVQIHRNDVSVTQCGITCAKAWGNDILTIANYIIPVQEGDIISLKVKSNGNDLMVRMHSLVVIEEYITSVSAIGHLNIEQGIPNCFIKSCRFLFNSWLLQISCEPKIAAFRFLLP